MAEVKITKEQYLKLVSLYFGAEVTEAKLKEILAAYQKDHGQDTNVDLSARSFGSVNRLDQVKNEIIKFFATSTEQHMDKEAFENMLKPLAQVKDSDALSAALDNELNQTKKNEKNQTNNNEQGQANNNEQGQTNNDENKSEKENNEADKNVLRDKIITLPELLAIDDIMKEITAAKSSVSGNEVVNKFSTAVQKYYDGKITTTEVNENDLSADKPAEAVALTDEQKKESEAAKAALDILFDTATDATGKVERTLKETYEKEFNALNKSATTASKKTKSNAPDFETALKEQSFLSYNTLDELLREFSEAAGTDDFIFDKDNETNNFKFWLDTKVAYANSNPKATTVSPVIAELAKLSTTDEKTNMIINSTAEAIAKKVGEKATAMPSSVKITVDEDGKPQVTPTTHTTTATTVRKGMQVAEQSNVNVGINVGILLNAFKSIGNEIQPNNNFEFPMKEVYDQIYKSDKITDFAKNQTLDTINQSGAAASAHFDKIFPSKRKTTFNDIRASLENIDNNGVYTDDKLEGFGKRAFETLFTVFNRMQAGKDVSEYAASIGYAQAFLDASLKAKEAFMKNLKVCGNDNFIKSLGIAESIDDKKKLINDENESAKDIKEISENKIDQNWAKASNFGIDQKGQSIFKYTPKDLSEQYTIDMKNFDANNYPAKDALKDLKTAFTSLTTDKGKMKPLESVAKLLIIKECTKNADFMTAFYDEICNINIDEYDIKNENDTKFLTYALNLVTTNSEIYIGKTDDKSTKSEEEQAARADKVDGFTKRCNDKYIKTNIKGSGSKVNSSNN